MNPASSEITYFNFEWANFIETLYLESRFFDKDGEKINTLKRIFYALDELQISDKQPAIMDIYPSNEGYFIFRARVVTSPEDVLNVINHPEKELGEPPSDKAESGRMNAEGISVFYGAQDVKTCISELQPPIGSFVVSGKFKLVNSIRILNLYDFTLHDSEKHCDQKRKKQIKFLKELSENLTRPITPDQKFHYLPAQVIAEYLKMEQDIDGIRFRSSQTDGKGFNIVLFKEQHDSHIVKRVDGSTPPSPAILCLDKDSIQIFPIKSTKYEYEYKTVKEFTNSQ